MNKQKKLLSLKQFVGKNDCKIIFIVSTISSILLNFILYSVVGKFWEITMLISSNSQKLHFLRHFRKHNSDHTQSATMMKLSLLVVVCIVVLCVQGTTFRASIHNEQRANKLGGMPDGARLAINPCGMHITTPSYKHTKHITNSHINTCMSTHQHILDNTIKPTKHSNIP